jgi:phospholipid transport system substrate-binding protein
MLRVILTIFLIPLFFVNDLFAEANGDEALSQVKAVIEQVRSTVKADKDKMSTPELNRKIRDILEPAFDFEELSKSCLGSNWNSASEAEQKEFTKLFSELLARTYLAKIKSNVEDSEITYLPSVIKGDRVVIKTSVKAAATEFAADYRVYEKDKKWRVYDVMVENVGLVTNYRSEFSGIIRKEGMTGLIAKLKEKVDKTIAS